MLNVDDLNTAVRALLVRVLAMPGQNVRPAGQIAPAGGQTLEIATVNILDSDEIGWAQASVEDDGSGGFLATTEVPHQFDASINFYRAPAKDAVGIERFSNAAFNRAANLPQILQRPTSVAAMAELGLGLITWSKPRNLRGVSDATWESRGQIDITFAVIARDTEPVDIVASVPSSITLQGNGGSVTNTKEISP